MTAPAFVFPTKASDLLELAVRDAQRAEKTPGYVLDMATWHDPRRDGTCAVCMAGAVMAMSCGLAADQSVVPWETFTKEQSKALDLIDDMRTGWFGSHDGVLGEARKLIRSDFDSRIQRAKDWGTYTAVVAMLRAEGL